MAQIIISGFFLQVIDICQFFLITPRYNNNLFDKLTILKFCSLYHGVCMQIMQKNQNDSKYSYKRQRT